MRKLFQHHSHAHSLASPLASPSSAPYPSLKIPNFISLEDLFFQFIPVPKSIFDLTTLCFVGGILLLFVLGFFFILYFQLRSRRLHHLQNFNSLWTVRLLLVTLASLWGLNEILRLPFVRRQYLYPFLPTISLKQQANICKLHVVLSLGLFEPSFLITLLLLINVSIKKRDAHPMWILVFVVIICSPILLLQLIFVYYSPFAMDLPKFMHGSSFFTTDVFRNRTVLCTYPFFSCIIFDGFTMAYATAFLLSYWRVLVFVINKGISYRINMLATTVMVALSVQFVCLSMSWLWIPEDAAYGGVVLVMFLCVALCMVVGEVILVLRPILDALAVGG